MSAIFGEILTFGQQNGPEVQLRVFGDEHYARYEELNGYTAIYDDERGQFCYARLAAGELRSTGSAGNRGSSGRSGAPPSGISACHRSQSHVAPIASSGNNGSG